MGRGILRGAGGDENLKFNFIWPNIINKKTTNTFLKNKNESLWNNLEQTIPKL